MPSIARRNLDIRLRDVEQLLDAHTALTKYKRAESMANMSSGLQQLTQVINVLVMDPGRGKPAQVEALNKSAIVLLCSHFQGYVYDLHDEAGHYSLAGKVSDVDAVIKAAKPGNSNPYAEVIDKMFTAIGIYEIMKKPRWSNCSNNTVRERLRESIQLRNKIAHGTSVFVGKRKVESFETFVILLSDYLDEEAARQIKAIAGEQPW